MTRTIEQTGTFPPLPEVDDATRRDFLVGAAALLVLAPYGCGGSQDPAAETDDGYPRTVKDHFEAVEVGSRPERILVNDPYMIGLDVLLALGVRPALVSVWEGWEPFSYQRGAEDLETMVQADSLNVEKVLAEEVDLIVTSVYPTARIEDKRYPNNPVPVIALTQGDFEGQLGMLGAALALERRAEEEAAKVKRLFASFEPPRVPESVKVFGTYGDGAFYAYKPTSGVSKTLERFGLPPVTAPEGVGDRQMDPEAVQAISAENIPELEADLLLGLNYGDREFDTIAGSPLFGQLEAVKEGRFTPLNEEESFALSYGSALSIPTAREAITRALE